MHRLAMLTLRDEDAARDIVHDVFASLLSAGPADVSAQYLLRAVRNRCLNYLRSLSSRQRFEELYIIEGCETAQEDSPLDSGAPDEDMLSLMRSTVETDLTDACRRVVRLRFTGGLSYKEIASELSISEVAVYKHLRRAIDVLRLKLSQNG